MSKDVLVYWRLPFDRLRARGRPVECRLSAGRKGYLYILRCADGSYYVGSTTNLELRVAEHQAGEGGTYTAQRLPVELMYACEFETLHEAFLCEWQVKGWSRKKKEALIRGDYEALIELSKSKAS